MPDVRSRCDEVEAALARSDSMFRSPRMYEAAGTDAMRGEVSWKPSKSIWISAMTVVAVVAGPLTIAPQAFALFVVTTAITICGGHSLGMHRRLIHRSFDCPLWLERVFVYLGTLVGMAGPYGMIRQHDIRDWAQRRTDCHPFLAHRSGFWRDAWWQLHCDLKLDHGPELVVEPQVAADPFYQFLDRTWMWQQLPWALLFWSIGGWPWVVWGIAVRVALSNIGHWLVGYFAHNRGPRNWHVGGAGVQGYNVPYVSILTMGEALHNNHHAYPASARFNHHPGEMDPGWWVLRTLAAIGLVWNLKTPETLPARENLVRVREAEAAQKKKPGHWNIPAPGSR
jgi:fatty-acid desaturase